MNTHLLFPSLLKRSIPSPISQYLLARSISTNSAINRGLRRSRTNSRGKRDPNPRENIIDSTHWRGKTPLPRDPSFKSRFPTRDRFHEGSSLDLTPRNKTQWGPKERRKRHSSSNYLRTDYSRPPETPDFESRPSPRLDYPRENLDSRHTLSPGLDTPSGIWNPPGSTPRPTAHTWSPTPEAYTDAFPGSRSWRPPGKPSPRLDYTPQDIEWTPKPRRHIPKLDYDAEWIYGTNVVSAALKAKRRKILRLYIYSGQNRTAEVKIRDKFMASMARGAGAEVVEEQDIGLLDSMTDSRPHNGYVLECLPLPKTPILSLGAVTATKSSLALTLAQHTSTGSEIPADKYDSIIYNRDPKKRYPFILMLDEITDPGNLGAILRTAYFLGVTAVILTPRNCAPLSPVCLKASAGAAEFLPILEQVRGDRVIADSVESGWTFYAAVPPITKQQLRRDRYVLVGDVGKKLEEGPVCLVLGSEGEGIRPLLKKCAQYCISLERAPGTDRVVDSLNVSAAAALLCNSFLKGA